jgi:hypothetical protein
MSRRIDPQLAEARMIAAGLQPLEPYLNAISNWRCKCLKCDQIVISRYNRVQQGSGCPRCAAANAGMRIRLSGEDALEKLKDYDLEPLEPYVKSNVPWKCRCMSCGDVVYPKLKNLQRGDGGCYKCGLKKAGLKNRLEEAEAFQVAKELGYLPLEPYTNALTKWKMQHSVCKAIVYPKLNSLRNAGGKTVGCAVCSGHQVEKGLNDLLTTHPQIAVEADGWDPTTVTAGSGAKKKWKCSDDHIWKTPVATRTSGHGCPTCSHSGFDPNKPSYLYFLLHPQWNMYQIGITNDQDERIRSHQRLGWEVIEVRGPMDGHLTQQWETAILRMLKAERADLSNQGIAGKFDGYSEAWSKSTFEVSSIKELMRLTEEYEEKS